MRALILACLVSLAGCIIDNDRVRVESFAADTPATFTYGVATQHRDDNDDGEAERIRRDWLAEALDANAMWRRLRHRNAFAQPWEGLFGNGGDVVYTGRCLQ
jgi:hypothetical protein